MSSDMPRLRRPDSAASSTVSSDSVTSSVGRIHDIVAEDPMYYTLYQFLMTEDGRNITSVLGDLVAEVRELRAALGKLGVAATPKKAAAPAPAPPTERPSA